MKAKTLMIQGTASSAGKSLLVTALCRIFARRGFSVAPFKSQNMSLNSYVTRDGDEIGRAQAVQAEAAGLEPSRMMNPILLKPGSDHRSQVIVNGKVHSTLDAREYYRTRHTLKPFVREAFNRLAEGHDLVLLEGAGSPAEINLRENDLANMGMAEMADAPVILVGDIDRGGVFASLYGTVALLPKSQQKRIRGLIINKFRGDPALLEPGLREITDLLNLPVLGVIPWLDVRIDEEDSLSERFGQPAHVPCPEGLDPSPDRSLDVAVIRLPRISNYTDFSALEGLPGLELRYVDQAARLGRPDLLILPGSKSTLDDLSFLHDSGLANRIQALHASGTPVIGICGGFQMLGHQVRDSGGVEGAAGEGSGLGLLEVHTVFSARKRTTRSSARVIANHGLLEGCSGMLLEGYEIHMGRTETKAAGSFCEVEAAGGPHAEGTVSDDGWVLGTYLHGLFDNLSFTATLLNNVRRARGLEPCSLPEASFQDVRQRQYTLLADAVENSLDMELLESIIFG